MFDFAWSEIALIGIVGLLFIGPKDMPVAIRTVTNLIKKGRKLAGEFQTHVDEMIREADLGPARDQLRQLRSLNVRGQIMKALDEDGSIKRTFDQNPLAPAGPRLAPPAGSPDGAVAVATGTDALPVQAVAVRPVLGFAGNQGANPQWRTYDTDEAPEDAALAAADPSPSIIPPRIASRLRSERAKAPPPRFVPPSATRPDPTRHDRPERQIPATGYRPAESWTGPLPQASIPRPDAGLS